MPHRVHLEFPLTRENMITAFRRALDRSRPIADGSGAARLIGTTGVAGFGASELGTFLRPIATPLVMAGFEPDVAATLGISEQQVANQKFDLLARLRTQLKKQNVSEDVFPELYEEK